MNKIGIVGAGAWGTALARTLHASGREVSIWARERDVAESINARHENPRFLPGVALDPAIEAATENMDLKKRIFAQMLSTFGENVVLATNTSSISIASLGESVGDAAGRVIGMHFFNPVPVMKLVEVITAPATSEQTTRRTLELARRMGKTPVPANDRAGFVSNRVLMPLINEAFHAWMDGVAEPEHIDEIMTLGCNFPMGPLRLADYIGLDVCVNIMNVMRDGLGSDKYAPCPKLVELVEQGRLGDKTGRGVFEHGKKIDRE